MSSREIIFVLCNPEESRNIGATCRAIKNMGFSQLRIVGDKQRYNIQQVQTLALDSIEIWDRAVFFPGLKEALADCVLAAGTTRRFGKKRKKNLYTPEKFAERVFSSYRGKIALVFGNERTGLTDIELAQCTEGVTIPSNPEFPSLNLSHSVQIIAYAFFTVGKKVPERVVTPSINRDRIDETTKEIVTSLEKIGFFKIGGKKDMENFWRSLLIRSRITETDAQYIEAIFTKIPYLRDKKADFFQNVDD